jgi:hypothetical protein
MAHKLQKYIETIRPAVDGREDLRENQKTYKKIYKYYKDLGITFTGDSESDYNLLLDCLFEDIY